MANDTIGVRSGEPESIYSALVEVQKELHPITKNTDGYGYKYADFAHIMDTTLPLLVKNGICVHFPVTVYTSHYGENNTPVRYHTLSCVLTHRNGERRSEIEIKPESTSGGSKMSPIQAFGSHLTYLKRYLYAGMLGISVKGEDDDGLSSGGTENTWGQQQPTNYGNKRKPEVANV